MQTLHAAVGFAIVGGFFVLFAWGGLWFLLKRQPNEWFWRLLAVLQIALLVQLVAGVVLLSLGFRRGLLHYAYGVVFPAVVLAAAHFIGRRMDEQGDVSRVFTLAAFFAFGLTLRALTTGLGLP